MLALLRSVLGSVASGLAGDPELRGMAGRHPRLLGPLRAALGPDAGLALRLAAGLLLSLALVLPSLQALEALASLGPVARADLRLAERVSLLRSPPLTELMLAATVLGDWELVLPAAALVCAALALGRRRRHAWALLASVAVGEGLVVLAKHAAQRPRPALSPMVVEATSSFPSGHALVAVAFYGLLAYLALRASRERWQRALSALAGAAVVLAIGLSRVYLGVHWPSDVLAGYAAGAAWLAVVIAAIEGGEGAGRARCEGGAPGLVEEAAGAAGKALEPNERGRPAAEDKARERPGA